MFIMKKNIVILLVLAACLVFTAASVWEGTASAAIGNEFPETGYYAATNSYPINTVVDITNLENGRTLRVIVMSNLENPGLLVMLSRDAASALGINPRSIGRVRMNQPSDAIAYSRFIGGYGVGDPDHDPAAMLAATSPNPELFTEESWSALIINEDTRTEEPLYRIIGEPSHSMTPVYEATPEPVFEIYSAPEEIASEPHFIYEPEPMIQPESIIQPEPIDPLAASPHTFYENLDEYEFVITSDFERLPPDYIYYIIDPSDIVETWESREPLAETQPSIPAESTIPREPQVSRDPAPEAFVSSIPVPPVSPAVQPAPAQPDPNAFVSSIVPPAHIPEEPWLVQEPAAEAFVPSITAPPSAFSVPVISNLESGMYYIQIGAYSIIDTVEYELSKHSNVYPMVVQDAGTPGNPVYRVLVGPLNLGESGAMLHRFRGIYSDAFVRQGQ